MKRRSLLVMILLVLSWFSAACSKAPATPDEAVRAARQFLQDRVARNAGAMQGLLTARAQQAMTTADVAQFIKGEQFSFGGVGTPATRTAGWVQVPVTDYRVQSPTADTRWPEVLLTMHYEGSRWAVAWIEPVAASARRAFENGRYGDELTLAAAISAIDPYHYRGPFEYHFAYRGLERFREAELALQQALDLATPVQQADVLDAAARFKLSLNHPEDAAPQARAALEKAAPYVPAVYPHSWQADTLVVLGRALLARGDRAGALDAANQAAKLDPQNATLQMLLHDLSSGS